MGPFQIYHKTKRVISSQKVTAKKMSEQVVAFMFLRSTYMGSEQDIGKRLRSSYSSL